MADIEASPTFAQRASSDRAVGTLDGFPGSFLRSATGCRAARGGCHGDVAAQISTREYWIGSCLGRRHIGSRRGGDPLADRLTGWSSTRFVGCWNQTPIESRIPQIRRAGRRVYGRLQAHNQTANALTRDTPTRAEMELVRLHADGGVGQFGHRLTRPSSFLEWASGAPSPANPFASEELPQRRAAN